MGGNKEMLTWPLPYKVKYARAVIREFYEKMGGKVTVSFSGGADSTLLMHLVRLEFPDVPGVFADTGLEFPEIREFVRSFDNIIWAKPKMGFRDVLEKYGYPVVSKEVSMAISRYRNTKLPEQKILRLSGGINPNTNKEQKTGVIPKKWRFLVNAPFKISDNCCKIMKKQPLAKTVKEFGAPFIGTTAADSQQRRKNWLRDGCTSYKQGKEQCRPLSIFSRDDIWTCLKAGIPYCKIYDMGYEHTGCIFCAFGLQFDTPGADRFQLLKKTHPKIYDYCMDTLNMREVLRYVGKDYE